MARHKWLVTRYIVIFTPISITTHGKSLGAITWKLKELRRRHLPPPGLPHIENHLPPSFFFLATMAEGNGMDL